MKINIDIKSLTIGLVLGLVLALTVAATQKSSESGAGRYKMIMNDTRVFILDSVTGKPWGIATQSGNSNTSNFFWKKKI